jgi:hypothetical protein
MRRDLLLAGSSRIIGHALGETNIPKVRQLNEGKPTMGDRSPKSVQKQASQKQSKANDANRQKQALIMSQQAAKAKAAAGKKN